MNGGFLAWMNQGNRYVQQFVAEQITIANFGPGKTIQTVGGTTYTCTVGKEFTLDLEFETGGAAQINKGSVLINKQDLLNAPIRGTIISFRGGDYRVTQVDDVVNAWEINMIQLSA